MDKIYNINLRISEEDFFYFLRDAGKEKGLGISTYIRNHLILTLKNEFEFWKKKRLAENVSE